jgi:hypothetical protein
VESVVGFSTMLLVSGLALLILPLLQLVVIVPEIRRM